MNFPNVRFQEKTYMKQKLSISIDEEKTKKIKELLKSSRFRSKSHLIEYSIDKFLEYEANNFIKND